VLDGPWDHRDDEPGPNWGLLDSHIGHGTFIAGVIRQIAPDASVRMIRVMHSDGVVQESALVTALSALTAEIAEAQARGVAEQMVDIVSLSFGYYAEDEDAAYTSGLARTIAGLTALGVAVVVAAGNEATDQPSFPAAFADPSGAEPVVSVGALNPNGSRAMFSNHGKWVTAWAPGADVVSTFPKRLDGGQQPVHVRGSGTGPGAVDRQTLDPDGFQGGFAVWSGTSFAAPWIAARMAAALMDQARSGSVLGLGDISAAAARQRIEPVVKQLIADEQA
jgi:subtilisin family serine protease